MTPSDATVRRRFQADDLYNIQMITRCVLSPDERHVVYAQQRIDRKTEKKPSDLWLVSADGSAEARRLTWGNTRDAAPAWSPDGNTLAFLSNRDNERLPQIYLMPMQGGESRQLTDLKGIIRDYKWSPDGTRIAITYVELDDEVKARMADEQKKKLGVVAHHVTRLTYKFDSMGFLPKNRMHLRIVDVESGDVSVLTGGEHDIIAFNWSPDGSNLIFTTNLDPFADFNSDASQLYRVSTTLPESGEPYGAAHYTALTDHAGPVNGAVYSPDGSQIAIIGRNQAGNWWQNLDLFVMSADGGELRNLTAANDLYVGAFTLNDVNGSTPPAMPRWSADGGTLYFISTHHGRQPVIAVDVASGETTTVLADDVVGPFALAADETRIVYFKGTLSDPGQLFARTLGAEDEVQLTQLNAWLADVDLGNVTEHWVESSDGYKVHGWILTPPEFDPEQQYPSILEIHGGPQTQYGRFFMGEFYYLAAQGSVVYFSNPRGGQGYGAEHCRAIFGDWGNLDYQDCMAWARHMAQQPYIDPARMGVTGGSYGGYMTTWIIGHTDFFKAAVAQRSVTNWVSMYGTADFNSGWVHLTGDSSPWEDLQTNWEHSPIAHLHKATTPTLFVHSLADYRTNFEQTEQAFVALKSRGIDSEMILFPSESHGLSRMGRTDRRIVRLEHIARWFDTYL